MNSLAFQLALAIRTLARGQENATAEEWAQVHATADSLEQRVQADEDREASDVGGLEARLTADEAKQGVSYDDTEIKARVEALEGRPEFAPYDDSGILTRVGDLEVRVTDIENISADDITGAGGPDSGNGGNANDTIADGAGNDTILGGQGNDSLNAGQADEHVDEPAAPVAPILGDTVVASADTPTAVDLAQANPDAEVSHPDSDGTAVISTDPAIIAQVQNDEGTVTQAIVTDHPTDGSTLITPVAGDVQPESVDVHEDSGEPTFVAPAETDT